MFRLFRKIVDEALPPCLRRLTKKYDGVDAWRIQKTHKGITFRACLSDRKTGGKAAGKKQALALLHIINSILSLKSLRLSFLGQKKHPKESTREEVSIPRRLVDEKELRKILMLAMG